jgi:hypothetical protein
MSIIPVTNAVSGTVVSIWRHDKNANILILLRKHWLCIFFNANRSLVFGAEIAGELG